MHVTQKNTTGCDKELYVYITTCYIIDVADMYILFLLHKLEQNELLVYAIILLVYIQIIK